MRIQESPFRTVYFFTSGPLGSSNWRMRSLRLFPYHASLFRQRLQQFQSFRQTAAVHQEAGFSKGLRTARPEGIIFSVRQNSLGTESRRQKAKEDLCA